MASLRRALITGANGYIAAQTVARFLAAGWAVRGTVRDTNSRSARELATHFAAEQAAGRFELVVVRDIKTAGAFDKAVQAVQAVAHLATPVVFDSGDVEYIVGTAVQGTLSILESALKAASASASASNEEGLKSFVLMSSVAAVRMMIPGPFTFTEKDWNTKAEAQVREDGDKAFGHVIYAASKVASERAFWDWVKEKKPPFAATVLNPCWVAGPQLYPPSSPEGIAETNSFIWKVFSGQDFPAGPSGYGTHVDVRDVARMTEWAASHPEKAGGERYIVGGNGNVGNPQAAADILRQAYPERQGIIKEGTPGEGYQPGYAIDPEAANVNSSKAINATGLGWIPYDKMILDAAKSFEALL
ncbi:NAD dependent epimerase/dehydratase [Xylaria sp. FL1777]|nr:NAD dependent epimerase/dehydratase [Xylaria sp. FL1777]